MRKIILAITALILAFVLCGCTSSNSITGNAVGVPETPEPAFVGGEPSCSDSDNGMDTSEDGTVTGIDEEGYEYSYRDKCVGGYILVEYYCEGDAYETKNIKCDCKGRICND
jgi:hypothetical protein